MTCNNESILTKKGTTRLPKIKGLTVVIICTKSIS